MCTVGGMKSEMYQLKENIRAADSHVRVRTHTHTCFVLFLETFNVGSQARVISHLSTEQYSTCCLTTRKGAECGGWDPCIDAPEAPGPVEALLALQSGLHGVQREKGKIHAHPGAPSSLGGRSTVQATFTLASQQPERPQNVTQNVILISILSSTDNTVREND